MDNRAGLKQVFIFMSEAMKIYLFLSSIIYDAFLLRFKTNDIMVTVEGVERHTINFA